MKRSLYISPLLALLLCLSSNAATLRSYENRIKRAAEQVERIKVDPEYSNQGIDTIRVLVPKIEKIDYDGKSVNVDNTWLSLSLDKYEAEKDPQQKIATLNEMEDKLRSLGEHLVRAEERIEGSKDTADPRKKLAQILSGPEYRTKQESRVGAFIKEVWRRIKSFLSELYQAFARLLGRIFGATSQGNWLAIVLVVAALAAGVIGIARVIEQINPRRRRGRKRTVLGEEIEAGTSPKDLAEAAMVAARAGDFRTAIRKLYISLLYDLAEREVIELDESVTNREYLSRLSRYSSLIPPIEYLTNRFDYCWYGMTPSSEQDFEQYYARYNEAMERAQSLSPQPAS